VLINIQTQLPFQLQRSLPYTQQRRDVIFKGDILVDAIKICPIIFFK